MRELSEIGGMSTEQTDVAPPASGAESHPFQAEVAELLRLMVHSVYSETDIFLRELISNASDALDRLRYEAISAPELITDGSPLAIRITPDKAAGTVTVSDNGIGMERQELIDHLGTVARSGTRAFMARLAESKDGAGLIGQFGVGFYSAFMVADRIEVTSRRAGTAEAFTWTSSGGVGFEIAPASAEAAARVSRGTEIVLHLKEEAKRYLEPYEIERIVRTYSDHILFPIELVTKEDNQSTTTRQINAASAPWQRQKSELKPQDQIEAYRTITGGFDAPAMTLHFRAEGRQSYAALLFAPSIPPYDLFEAERKGRVKLYVRRVFITLEAVLLPPYLRFMRGVVDSEDLPLNISREMLQNNPQVAQIRKALTGRVIAELEQLAAKAERGEAADANAADASVPSGDSATQHAKPEKTAEETGKEPDAKDEKPFAKIWKAFGRVLKEGLYEDHERRDQLLRLARFSTTAGEMRSLKQYVADLKLNQTEIYYLVGDSIERLKANPKLEAARARGIEVLLLTDPIDAFWTAASLDFDGKPLKSLSQGEIDFRLVPLLDSNDKPQDAAAAGALDEAMIVAAIKLALGERVSDVRVSQRLTDSPACLVAGGSGPDRELERMLARHQVAPTAKPILELNLRHPLLKALAQAKADGREIDVTDLSQILLEEAQILDGETPADPAAFTSRLNRLIMRGLGVAP